MTTTMRTFKCKFFRKDKTWKFHNFGLWVPSRLAYPLWRRLVWKVTPVPALYYLNTPAICFMTQVAVNNVSHLKIPEIRLVTGLDFKSSFMNPVSHLLSFGHVIRLFRGPALIDCRQIGVERIISCAKNGCNRLRKICRINYLTPWVDKYSTLTHRVCLQHFSFNGCNVNDRLLYVINDAS